MANYLCVDGCGQPVSAKNKRCRKCAGVLRRKHPGGMPRDAAAQPSRLRPAAPTETTGEPIPAGDWVTVNLRRGDAEELSRLADSLGAQRLVHAEASREADATELRKMITRARRLLSAAAALRAALVE